MRVWVALWTVYVVWGSTYLAIRVMVETMPPLLSSGARFGLAGVVFAVVLLARRGAGALRVTRPELVGCAVVGALLLLGGNGLVAVGEDAGVPSGLAALLVASVPLWVVLLRKLGGDDVSRVTALWVAMGFVGVAVLLLPGDRPEDAPLGGLLTILAAALCWASGSYGASRLRMPADPILSTSLQMLCGGGLMVLVALAAGEAGQVDAGAFSLDSILAFAYLVLIGSLVAFTAYVWLLRHAPVSQVATYAYVNPVVAIALGALILDEPVTGLVAAGATIIVASVAGTVREEAGRRAAPVARTADAGVGSER